IRKITSIICNDHPESVHIRRDIYNTRTNLRRRNFNGYTLVGASIKVFNSNNIKYIK
ncbi:hypothetical protein QR685DRAFT_416992, partial [Neurospora intermedia]